MNKRFTFSFNFDDTFGLALESIEHQIEVLAKGFAPFNFIRGSYKEIDMKMERTEAPFIVLFAPTRGNVTEKGYVDVTTTPIRVGFFDMVNREAWAEDNMAVAQAMKVAGQCFIKAMNESGLFEPITEKPYQIYEESFTTHVTGVVFELNVKQSEGVCIPNQLEWQ